MAKYKKTGTLDSYATIKAIARASPVPPPAKPAEPAPPEVGHAPADSHEVRPLGAHVARTVVPTRQVIQCYACGYTFQLHGRAKQINCSKCKLVLDLTDHVIAGPSTATVKTAGRIHVKPEGIIQAGELVAQEILLEGTVESGSLRAMRRLEIAAGAMFAERTIQATDLRIGPGAAVVFKQPAEYRHVEIAGALQARLHTSGVVTILPGGLLTGELTGPHLVVLDGGGLQASVRVES